MGDARIMRDDQKILHGIVHGMDMIENRSGGGHIQSAVEFRAYRLSFVFQQHAENNARSLQCADGRRAEDKIGEESALPQGFSHGLRFPCAVSRQNPLVIAHRNGGGIESMGMAQKI